MSRDLEQLLRDTAATPAHEPDPHELVARGRRRRRARHTAAAAGVLAAVAVTAVAVAGPLTRPGVPQIADQPSPTAPASPGPSPTPSASPGPSLTEGGTAAPGDAADDEPDGRQQDIARLERERRRLEAVMQELRLELGRLWTVESELQAREDAGDDVETERRELAAEVDEVRRRLEDLARRQFALEQQLAELGALEDPVAVARAAATDEDRAIADALIAFAEDPGAATVGAVPFAPSVELGLGRDLTRRVDAAEVADPSVWVFTPEVFRGRDGEMSALQQLGRDDVVQVLAGDHPHCASPPLPAPTGYEQHRRVSIQPIDHSSCLEWWTVDLFLDDDGRIAAVTLDLWDP